MDLDGIEGGGSIGTGTMGALGFSRRKQCNEGDEVSSVLEGVMTFRLAHRRIPFFRANMEDIGS